jgi:putative oxidoreductase
LKDDSVSHSLLSDGATLLGRFLIAALFVGGAVQKANDPSAVTSLLGGMGWPVWLIWPAMIFNAVAAVSLIFGIALRPVAAALALYCGITSIFHYLPDDPWQMTIFVKNWAIAGGCLILAAHGAGRFALRP